MLKIPNDDEYESFDGMHCSMLWQLLSEDWYCLSCGRNKRELMRWGKRVGSNARIYGEIGWKIALHRHHDHGNRWSGEVVICGDCNSADATVKKEFSLTDEWSFTVEEIRQFIYAAPNDKIKRIDFATARTIYDLWYENSHF